MLCSRANHRAASQAVASDKRQGIPNTFIHYKGVTVQLSLHAPLHPRAFNQQQYNHTCREELATSTQVALEAVTTICCQHLSMLHIIAQQSVLYTHKK